MGKVRRKDAKQEEELDEETAGAEEEIDEE